MKPIFTVHAGEYIVGSHIEKTYKNARVWLPSKDTGVDLLVTNESLDKAISLQVKFSKDFLGENKSGLSTRIKAGGWWTFNAQKIEKSPAHLWVLVLYRFAHRDFDFVIIKPTELLARYRKLKRNAGTIQSYVWVTGDGRCWETRGLRKDQQKKIVDNKFQDDVRDLTKFLNNWKPLEDVLGLGG